MELTNTPAHDAASGWRNRPVERTCRKCGIDFVGKYNSSTCKPCKSEVRAAAHSKFRDENPDYWVKWQKTEAGRRARKKVVLDSYGLTATEYDAMLQEQGGVCAICAAEPGAWRANGGGLVIDHDHSTGRVRGLLCPSCNRGLGQFDDDPVKLANAVSYLSNEADQ